MKGVVLAGGSGTRLRPLTHSMAKQLVPVANRPILDYGLTDIAEAGIEEVCIIISPQTGDDIRRSVGDGARFGLDVTYVVQDEPAGLAHALGCALPWVDGDDVLMYLGDNLVKGGVADIVGDWFEHRPQCQILLTPVPNPSAFGVAELDGDGHVVRLVEKPSRPRSDLALVGVYLFDHTVAAAIDAIRPSARGELEITDAIQWLVDSGHEVNASIVRGWWKDTGRREDLLQANALVLRDLESRIDGEVLDCTVRGAVVVEPGARLVDCAITGPAVVGPDADVRRTEIGPNTAIGPGCDIADARIEGSIVMAGARVHNWSLSASVVGNDSHLLGAAPDEYVQVTLGAHSEVLGQ